MEANPYMEVSNNPYMSITDALPRPFQKTVPPEKGMVVGSLGSYLEDIASAAERYTIGVGQALPAVGSAFAAGIAAPLASLNAQLAWSLGKEEATKVGEELAGKITYVPDTPEGKMIAQEAMKPLNWAIEKIVMPVVGPPGKAVGQMVDESVLGDALESIGLSRDIGSNLVETGTLFGGIGGLFTLIKKAPGLAKAGIESFVRGITAKNLEVARSGIPMAVAPELPPTGKGFIPPPAKIPVTGGEVTTRPAPQEGLMEGITTSGLEILQKSEKGLPNPYMEVASIIRKKKGAIETKANPYLAVEEAKVAPPPAEIVQSGAKLGGPNTPVRENGGYTSILLDDGTALIGGKIHGETYDMAVKAGFPEDKVGAGMAGFTRPDGTTWNLQGKFTKAQKVINLDDLQPGAKVGAKPLSEMTNQEWQDSRHVLRRLAESTDKPDVKAWAETELSKYAKTHEEQIRFAKPVATSVRNRWTNDLAALDREVIEQKDQIIRWSRNQAEADGWLDKWTPEKAIDEHYGKYVRGLGSASGKPLKKGETWRGRLTAMAERAPVATAGGEADPLWYQGQRATKTGAFEDRTDAFFTKDPTEAEWYAGGLSINPKERMSGGRVIAVRQSELEKRLGRSLGDEEIISDVYPTAMKESIPIDSVIKTDVPALSEKTKLRNPITGTPISGGKQPLTKANEVIEGKYVWQNTVESVPRGIVDLLEDAGRFFTEKFGKNELSESGRYGTNLLMRDTAPYATGGAGGAKFGVTNRGEGIHDTWAKTNGLDFVPDSADAWNVHNAYHEWLHSKMKGVNEETIQKTAVKATQDYFKQSPSVLSGGKQPWEMTKSEWTEQTKELYHGTRSENIPLEFDIEKSRSKPFRAWLAEDYDYASSYGNVEKYRIYAKNPLDITKETMFAPGEGVKELPVGEWVKIFNKKGLKVKLTDPDFGDVKVALWDLLDGADIDATSATNLKKVLSQSKYDSLINIEANSYGDPYVAHGLLKQGMEKTHENIIKQALSEGRPVPPEVLKDYPELKPPEAGAASELFIRAAKKSEIGNPTRSLSSIPDKEGYKKVFKPYGEQGRGFYYVPKDKGPGTRDIFFEPSEGFVRRPVEPEGTGEPIKRSDIVKFLTEKLDIPIRTGRFRQKALGIFKPKLEVVRSKFANDIETIAHEIGHGLNKYLWGMKGKNLETAPLDAFANELLPIATKAAKGQPQIQEGFAEFIRRYITNEPEAKKIAPKFYEFFEKELDKKSPEAKEIFIDARNQFDKWIKQPATQRVLGQLSIGETKKKPITWNNLYTQWVDELHPLKKVVDAITKGDEGTLETTKNPYELARLMAGWTGKADAFLEHKTFGFNDYQWKNKSLKDILNPVKDDLDNLRAYAVAKRALELRSREIETGITREDAIKVIKEQGKYENTLSELKQYQDDVLSYLLDSGVLGPNEAIKMKRLNQDYIPFYRVMESDKAGMTTRKGFEAGKPVKKIKGSWRDIVDPLESIIKNTYAFIQTAEKNAVVKSLVDLSNKHEGMGKFVEKIPIPMQKIIVKEPELLGILQKYGKWTETVKYKETQKTVGEKITQVGAAGEEIAGGSARVSELMESQAMEALKARGRSEAEARQILDRIKKAPTAEIKMKIIEKTIEKMAVQETVREFGLDIPNNIVELFRPSAFVPKENVISLWRKGKRELYQVHPDVARVIQALDRESTNSLVKILSYPSRWLRAGATLTPEFILRNPLRDQFSAFVYSKYGFVPGIDLGKGIAHLVKGDDIYWKWKIGGGEHSMLVSLDREYLQKSIRDVLREKNAANIAGSIVTNPLKALQVLSELTEEGTRIGEFTKGLTKEGMSKEAIMKSAFASRGVTLDFARKGSIGKEVNKLVAFWNANVQGTDKLVRTLKSHPIEGSIKIISSITIPSVALYMANRNDPRWKEIPAWQKNLFWIIMTENNIYRIPKPFELGILFGSFPEKILEAIDSQNPKILDSLWQSMAQGATPGYVPNVVLPIAENWANKSFFMDRPIVAKGREGMMEAYQYQPYTTELAKAVGKGIDSLTGIGVSPAKMENLIRGWTGGIGNYVLNIADKGLRMAGVLPDPPQPAKTFSDLPILKAFSVRYPGSDSESIRQFYENYEKNQEIKTTALGLAKKEYKGKEALELLNKSDYIKMDAAYKMMSNAQRFIQLIYANPTMKPEEKRQLIDKTYFQMIAVAKDINKTVRR